MTYGDIPVLSPHVSLFLVPVSVAINSEYRRVREPELSGLGKIVKSDTKTGFDSAMAVVYQVGPSNKYEVAF